MTDVSVVVRSKDEAPRLRLTLASLAAQTHPPREVIVVNDGSRDETADVLRDAEDALPLAAIRHDTPRGRSVASNAGAALARGEVLLFLDGDTLAGPDVLAQHRATHQQGPHRIGRGATWHLPGTRLLRDPEAGVPFPENAARVAALPADERARMRVSQAQIRGDFAGVHARARPGIYAGAGPRRLYELEMEALTASPDCRVLWAAASGSNLSVRRVDFLRAGGFHPKLDINEHRELALRLCQDGARMVPVPGAVSYHMLHRTGWRDPLGDTAWFDLFMRLHPLPEVRLLPRFWASLSDRPSAAGDPPITSLPALEAAAHA